MSIALFISDNNWELYMESKEQLGLDNRIEITLYKQKEEGVYPINLLRNIAIKNVKTTHFFMADMDMWPSDNLYYALRELPDYVLSDEKFAGIIPAFEVKKPSCNSFQDCVDQVYPMLPNNKTSLIACLKSQKCFLYREMRSTHVGF